MRLLKSNQRRRSVIVQAMLYLALYGFFYLTIKLVNGSKASCQALLSVCVVIGRFASAGDDGLVLIWNVEVNRTELYEYANYMLMIW